MIKPFKLTTLKKSLILYITFLLVISSLLVGVFGYFIARNALINRGKITLQNGVNSALILIEQMNEEVESGYMTLEKAQELVKSKLVGPMQEDGTRLITTSVNFGKNGYYIIYSTDGVEILHPTLEGQNVWGFIDKKETSKPFYLVQDKIRKALNGGGFTQYTWEYPYSDKLGEKIVYSKYDPNWQWVVTAGSYISDFDQEALIILQVTAIVILSVVLLGIILSIKYIHTITSPLSNVVAGMKTAEAGKYARVENFSKTEEMLNLINGFNNMIESIETAQINLVKKDDQLLRYAYYDSLTGLPNSYYYRLKVSAKMIESPDSAALLLVDIKDFNFINSVYGSEYGDQVLAYIGNQLLEICDDEAIVARVGGNEFAIWYSKLDEQKVEELIHEQFNRLKMNLRESGLINHIDFYMGLYVTDGTNCDFDKVLNKATIALQNAKNSGIVTPNRYDELVHQIIERESRIIDKLETAIDNVEFKVYYQSKVNAFESKIIGVEGLARWQSSELGFVSPGEFIPLITRANLMLRFTRMIFTMVCEDFEKLLQKYGESVTVSVNISPALMFDSDFLAFMNEKADAYHVPKSQIVLEITEDIFISDLDLIQKQVNQLKQYGFKIALDDFGTGYSSLNYLAKVKFDEIKVDKTFVDPILFDQSSYDLFKSIVRISEALDCMVVAEGVETVEQVNRVMSAGCHMIQGYYYSKPTPL